MQKLVGLVLLHIHVLLDRELCLGCQFTLPQVEVLTFLGINLDPTRSFVLIIPVKVEGVFFSSNDSDYS